MVNEKKVGHFLNSIYLHDSPPNDALKRAYKENGFDVVFFANNPTCENNIEHAVYGINWLLRNMFRPYWRQYSAFSATSEDPIVVAGVLAFIWRKPLIFISDEIKSGSYSGDRPSLWKKICRWAMRQASLTIVNDNSRIQLQRDYAGLSEKNKVMVYPGCFLHPPQAKNKSSLRGEWEVSNDEVVLGFSGACNLTAGIDWALESLGDHDDIKMIAQPLSLDSLSRYFFENHRNVDQIYLQQKRLSWQDSWASMGGVDIGVAVYTNSAPQFQLMGISSNRLCMFLAMGVPVIVSRQDSFAFIEEYNCGVLVENAEEFSKAVTLIKSDLGNMKKNALRCAEEYINTKAKFEDLVSHLKDVLHS